MRPGAQEFADKSAVCRRIAAAKQLGMTTDVVLTSERSNTLAREIQEILGLVEYASAARAARSYRFLRIGWPPRAPAILVVFTIHHPARTMNAGGLLTNRLRSQIVRRCALWTLRPHRRCRVFQGAEPRSTRMGD